MSRSLLSEEICPDLRVYMEFMNMNFLNIIFLNMNMLFFFMRSFIELSLSLSFFDFSNKHLLRRGCAGPPQTLSY